MHVQSRNRSALHVHIPHTDSQIITREEGEKGRGNEKGGEERRKERSGSIEDEREENGAKKRKEMKRLVRATHCFFTVNNKDASPTGEGRGRNEGRQKLPPPLHQYSLQGHRREEARTKKKRKEG